MRVKSAVDLWVSLVILLATLIIGVSLAIAPAEGRWIIFPLGLIGALLMLWLYFGTYYELKEDHLFCKSGPFTERIPYNRIKSLKLSENLLSSMAMSRQRIEITQHNKGYITGTTFISPVNREDFLAELTSRCSNLNE